jgi:hypothetical protein
MDHTQQRTVDWLQHEFDTMWQGADPDCLTPDLPTAVREKLLSESRDDRPPSEDEFRSLWRRAFIIPENEITPAGDLTERADFQIPADLNYTSGDYEHEGRAVSAWCSAAFRGGHRLWEDHHGDDRRPQASWTGQPASDRRRGAVRAADRAMV